MKKYYFLIFLFSYGFSFSQTGTYNQKDDVMSIELSTIKDVLTGYPTIIEAEAIEYYNKGTEIIYTDANLAINYFLKAIKIDPNFVQAYDNIGKAYRMIKEYDLAMKYYKYSIALFPNGDAAHINLALVYNKLKRHQDAIIEYKKVIRILPEYAEGYYGLANTYLYYTDELELALTNAKKALVLYKKNPPNYIGDSYCQMGLIYYYLENYSDAKRYIQIAKEKYIENNLEQAFRSNVHSSILKKLSIE